MKRSKVRKLKLCILMFIPLLFFRVLSFPCTSHYGTHTYHTLTLVGYNAYVETIGHAIGAGACVAVRRGNKLYTIADDMPLLHFLSG